MDRIVLDTNIVLDWLVFREPAVDPLRLAVESGQLLWLVCDRMREEFDHMVKHPRLARWLPDVPGSLATFDRHSVSVESGTPGYCPQTRCTDPDDQVFIDLALAQKARWLVSRDRALLRLARRTKPLGLLVVTPEAWPTSR
jgi:putative PIN family toxin of toxin-antitoxin system